MNAVAMTERESAEIVPLTEAGSLMAVISRAASDPGVDVDKLERLMGLYERVSDRTSKAAFASALSAMQPELPVITERGEIVTKKGEDAQSTYAKWEDINEAIRPHLAAHGFALSFRTGLAADGKITVTGVLSHREGHSEETTMTLPHDSSGNKNAVQAVGSSTSYGKRYTAMALLNITTRGEDDDGKTGGEPEWVTTEQLGELQELVDSTGADRNRFLGFFKIEALAHLPKRRFDEAVKMLQAKARR